jgi:hypothetical protein
VRSSRRSAGARRQPSATVAKRATDLARILIVGCGCRGRELAAALVEQGHAVRGTTRSRERCAQIEAAGAEAVVADPDRLGSLLHQIEGVSVLCWLLGPVDGDAGAALHGPRLESMFEALVDTHVRGVVYEGPSVETARRFSRTFRMPVEVLGDGAGPAEAAAAVAKILG